MHFMTEITRAKLEGREPDLKKVNHNKKPYRTPAQKAKARENARKVDGTYYSNAPVSYHPEPRS